LEENFRRKTFRDKEKRKKMTEANQSGNNVWSQMTDSNEEEIEIDAEEENLVTEEEKERDEIESESSNNQSQSKRNNKKANNATVLRQSERIAGKEGINYKSIAEGKTPDKRSQSKQTKTPEEGKKGKNKTTEEQEQSQKKRELEKTRAEKEKMEKERNQTRERIDKLIEDHATEKEEMRKTKEDDEREKKQLRGEIKRIKEEERNEKNRLKEELHEVREENERIRQRARDLKKERDEKEDKCKETLYKYQQAIKDNIKLHDKRESLKEKIRKMREELGEMEDENDELTKRIRALEEQQRSINDIKERGKELERENAEKDRKINNLKIQLKVEKEEADRLTERLAKQKIEEKQRGVEQLKEAAKGKMLIIGDSNGKRILPALQKEIPEKEWVREEGIYREEDILNALTTNATQQRIEESEGIVMMMGTNHLRDGERAEEVEKRIGNVLKELRKKQVMVVEVPPFGDSRQLNSETRILNALILNRVKEENQQIIQYRENIRDQTLEELMEDNIHISRTGEASKIIAREVRKKIDNMNQRGEEEQEIVKTITVENDRVGILIGKQGRNIRNLTEENKVKIDKEDMGAETEFTVKGKEEDVSRTIRYIYATTNSKEIKQSRRDIAVRRQNRTCRFYINGTCKKGEQCNFDHVVPIEYRNINRSRSPLRNFRN
jgi:hypothetical protein